MQGFWAALAEHAGWAWWIPTWWPYWDAGMPFEYTYAPLLPALVAFVARVAHIPEIRAVQWLTGAVYCLGPVSLAFAVWRLGKSPYWAFAAGVIYSLWSPALLVAPNERFAFANVLQAERLYLMSSWDETPHMLALALWPIAVLALFRILETRRLDWLAFGVLCMSGMVYASAFGAMLLCISAACVLVALGVTSERALTLLGIGLATYAASCAALPPSLITSIAEAAKTHGDGWSSQSWTALALIALAWALMLRALNNRLRLPYERFFVLFTITALLIVWIYQYAGRHFVPQPGRYKLELSLGLAVTAIVVSRHFWKYLSNPLRLAIVAVFVSLSAEQVIASRVFAKASLRETKLNGTIEYRAAAWMDSHLDPSARVMVPGSIAQWLNAFSPRPQWTGGSWATAPNQMQQRAATAIYTEQGGIEGSVTWLQAFGVQAVMTSGKSSPEFWKNFTDAHKYEGRLDRLWKEEDTALYRIPLRSTSLAHALPASSRPNEDWASIQTYVAALNRERQPGLSFDWQGKNKAIIRGVVERDEAVSVQVTHHSGWRVRANGRPVPFFRDGIGLLWITPDCSGDCTLELNYSGGLELIACRVLSALSLIALMGILLQQFSTRRGVLVAYQEQLIRQR